ncbi:MAG: hypothetical protein HY814_09800, partial [Candidatus Riflebacteria bacterium]|nr:hypothetical protein [Candidatus Riflebacteria bacterium]
MSRFWQSFGFAARMTRRDFRAHAGALAFFSAAVALGVGVMVATDTLAAAIASKLQAEGKSLLGADLELRSRKPFPKEFDARLDALDGTRVHLVRTVETLSMVSGTLPASQARLCSLKAVGPGYPLYGEVLTDPPGAWKELVSRGGVLLAPALAMQLGVRPGESVMAGKSRLPVLGELRAEPDHLAEAFHLGPRMMMRLQDLPATGLLAPGSRGTWRALLRLAPGTDAAALARELAKSAPDGDVEAATAEEGPEGARRLLSRVNGFLGLSGLCVLLLAGVATAMAVHTHLVQRLDSLAIFKCLGATGRGLVTMVLFETLALSTVGALAGAAAGLALARWLPTLLAGVFPFEVDA